MVSPTEEWLMAHSRKALVPFLLIIMILGILVQYASATATQFTVRGGQDSPVTVNLATEDHVLIRFNVVGTSENTIDFRLVDPHENVTAEFSRKGDVSYTFVCGEGGDYVMHFSNVFSSEDKLITLEYEIEHYFFGLPQMLFMVLVVVVIYVAAVAVFILMGKPR
jgi:hypothetical protein